jgi:hypothetical protein
MELGGGVEFLEERNIFYCFFIEQIGTNAIFRWLKFSFNLNGILIFESFLIFSPWVLLFFFRLGY